MRSAGAPAASFDTPIRRPGIERWYCGLVARIPECGPPLPAGSPKRLFDPTTMSAPHSLGGRYSASAIRSTPATTFAPAARALAASAP